MDQHVVYDENGVAYQMVLDGDGGLAVIDEDDNVFSLVLTEA